MRYRAAKRVSFAGILIAALTMAGVTGHAQPADLHPGLEVFTNDRQPRIAEDAIGLRFTGAITAPLARDLEQLLLGLPQIYNHVVLELDSGGGELTYVTKVVDVLRKVKARTEFTTRVLGGGKCASGCIALFMQGSKRKASGASVWVFHGACSQNSNVPSPDATQAYLEILRRSGVRDSFLCRLTDNGYVTQPGNLFLSGYELFHHTDSGIITELLPAWQPENPVFPPVSPPR
jgi:ATP-dependent protease ClpP protease subunit